MTPSISPYLCIDALPAGLSGWSPVQPPLELHGSCGWVLYTHRDGHVYVGAARIAGAIDAPGQAYWTAATTAVRLGGLLESARGESDRRRVLAEAGFAFAP